MKNFLHSQLLDPSGNLIWQGDIERCKDYRSIVKNLPAESTLINLSGNSSSTQIASCKRIEVLKLAEKLGFVSKDGCAKGIILEKCVQAFNRSHLNALSAVQMEFPLVFNLEQDDLVTLTQSYERQNRMFSLEPKDKLQRLSYAADPGLFSWLRGKKLNSKSLPFAIYSPTPVFRRLKTGEIGGLDRLRQYTVPDLHILCLQEQTLAVYEKSVTLAAKGARFWLGESFAQFIDIEQDFYKKMPSFAAQMARAAKQYTVVNILVKRPRYYALRTGIVSNAGFGNIMLYNLQWDDTNGARFNICLENGSPVFVIHATVAGGWPKLLPLFLGRGLAGIGSKVIPPEINPIQIVCLPLFERHSSLTLKYAKQLEEFSLRVLIEKSVQKNIGERLKALRFNWQPYHVIIGDMEIQGKEVQICSPVNSEKLTLKTFLELYKSRLDRCRPYEKVTLMDLPFFS